MFPPIRSIKLKVRQINWSSNSRLKKAILFIFLPTPKVGSAILLISSLILFWPQGSLFPDDYSTIVYDRDGKMLSVFLNQREQWHFPADDALIVPEKLKTCVTEFEDRWFYWHPGINPVSIVRAVGQNLASGKVISGASTITMQVARISAPKARTLWNKFSEVISALRTELRYSKDEILKLYLDHAPYGGNVVGYRAASWRYFAKRPAALTWAEAATLAVLPNAPGLISPQSNPRLLRDKRDRLLTRLQTEGKIDAGTLKLARLEAIPDRVYDLPFKAPHLSQKLHLKGSRRNLIYTTIDAAIQQQAEQVIADHASYLKQYDIKNSAALICRTQSGEVSAYIGSQDFWDTAHDGMVDGVAAPRSSGSLLKPFLYALSIDQGLVLPITKIRDIPSFYGPFSPSNADENYRGLVTVKDALVHSLNVPATRLLNMYGYADFYDYLKAMGLDQLFRPADEYGLPLILGGAEVTLWEMAELYRGLALGGRFGKISPLRKNAVGVSPRFSVTKDRDPIGQSHVILNEVKNLMPDKTGDSSVASSFRMTATKTDRDSSLKHAGLGSSLRAMTIWEGLQSSPNVTIGDQGAYSRQQNAGMTIWEGLQSSPNVTIGDQGADSRQQNTGMTIWEGLQSSPNVTIGDQVTDSRQQNAGMTIWEGLQSSPNISIGDPAMENYKQLITPGAAWLTLQMLRELNRPGSEFYWQQYQNQWPLAWKTGTSYGQRDAWAVGVNPQWTIAVWVGNFSGEGNPELAGSRSAGPILFDLFNMLPKDKKQIWFERPEARLSNIKLCAWSGYKASANCPLMTQVDAPRAMGYMRLCPWHQTIFVNSEETQQVCSLCWQQGHYKKVQRLILPPDINQYLRMQGQILEKVPLHNPQCPAEQNASALQIIYPTANTRIWLPRDYGGIEQKVTLKAAHRNPQVKIYWYLDDHYLGETMDAHNINLTMENGKHTLVLVDAFGRRARRIFYSTKAP